MNLRADELCRLGRMALPLMTPNAQAEALQLLSGMEELESARVHRRALRKFATEFENAMQPVCKALVFALQSGDTTALHDLHATLPQLLAEVNGSPDLADALLYRMEKALVKGLTTAKEEITTANAPVTEALQQWRSREIFPTDFSSLDMRGLSSELRMRSVFSARVTNADFLSEISRVVDDMLSGKINRATGRWELMKKLKQLGYDPEIGFPDEPMIPAEIGSLQDLSSDARLDMILETNERMAANYGLMVAGNTPYSLREWPAWQLQRLYLRNIERGSTESHSAGWERRWRDAGEAVEWQGAVQEPMIARKDSPIWLAVGEGAGGYTDTLDNPFPPFAFNSGMAWQAVDRQRCIDLGLIGEDETPGEMEGQLSPGAREVNEAFDRMPPDLQEELRRELSDYVTK
ncbi:MAG: hypothetical protein ABI615_01780 [Chthoniobacterales bacterium]